MAATAEVHDQAFQSGFLISFYRYLKFYDIVATLLQYRWGGLVGNGRISLSLP